MCGIFGVIGIESPYDERVVAHVERGVEQLTHRGPDDSGIASCSRALFGHTRLSIIDLDGGHQPMWSEDRRGLITYNGEVYNHLDIRQRLEREGFRFATRCDTETVLAAYLHWGPRCVEELRGMFAFAAIDTKRKTALLARDRLGIKPLYWTQQRGLLYFSSELEPLYRTIGPFPLDPRGLDDYLAWQYIQEPRTIYQDVFALPPGHLIEIDLERETTHQRRYWQLHFSEDRSLSLADWETRLDEELREAVRLRLMSDVPFGCLLSGGIDSTLVATAMADILEEPPKTFSIGFAEQEFSELEWAERAAKETKTDHHTEIVKPESLSLLPTLVRHYGQPFADSSAIPTFYVSRMARKHVTMVLSGDGGDENFAGYHSYETVLRELQPPELRSFRSRALARWALAQAKRLADPIERAYHAHCRTARHFSPNERRALLRGSLASAVCDFDRSRRAHMEIGKQPLISRLQHLDLMTYLPFDILTKVDRASMAHSLEVRVPLLDHVFVETAATMPAEHKLKKKQDRDRECHYDKKVALKRLLSRRFSPDFVERRKMGFGVPLGHWFNGSLRQSVRQRLLESEYLPLLMRTERVRNLVESHSETNDQSTRIWNLLFLEAWIRDHAEAA